MNEQQVPSFESATVEAVAAILGETKDGLSNAEIKAVLFAINLNDPLAEEEAANPAVRQGLAWVKMSKRERITSAITRNQAKYRNGTALIGFITETMRPARYTSDPERHRRYQAALNQVLVLEGLKVTDKGRVAKGAKASTLSEAARLAGTLTTELRRREAHDLALAYCTEEILAKDVFHAVHEAVKGICQRLRDLTGSATDGHELIGLALDRGKPGTPLLRLNDLATDTDWNEQVGLVNLIRGLWARYRNPTSHETRVRREAERPIVERELLEVLTTVSLIHHALDSAKPPVSKNSRPGKEP